MAQVALLLAVVAGLLSAGAAHPHQAQPRASSTPSVDLGYEIHTATINETGGYYIFSNIPYAEQPVGDLRFQKPVLVSGSSETVNNSTASDTVQCMQAYPEWIVELQAEAAGYSTEVMEQYLWSAAGQTESCLVLDVYVPTSIFESGATSAPVLVWIHGGGFTYGSKTGTGDPATIIARSQLNNAEGVIFVSINYRLGMYGWLGGSDDITPNLGLYDQLVALEWVQEYIGKFGGSASDVTVLGESAGASSILHHITSYGGGQTLPFQKAITQSPAFQFNSNLTSGYELTMAYASNISGSTISTVAELAALDADTLKEVNEQVVLSASTGFFIYGVAVDSTYVPQLPQVLLAEGKFNSDVKVMAGHNSAEAVPFTSQSISTDADVRANLETAFPEISNETVNYILDVLYPSSDYAAEFYRAAQISTDSSFACSTRYLALAFDNNTYNYLFAVSPGYHAEDTSYTFFNGDTTTLDDGLAVVPAIAYDLQDSILGFTMAGDPNSSPNGALSVTLPVYGSSAQVLKLTENGLSVTTDDMANERCTWWQQAMIEGLV